MRNLPRVESLIVAALVASPAAAQWAGPAWHTERVGFFDAQHTSSSGKQVSTPLGLTDGRFAAGTSNRYSGANQAGASAWFWSPANGTERIGYYTGIHSATNGLQSSEVSVITSAGAVLGSSRAYNAANDTPGETAWIYHPGVGLTQLGPIDATHTDPQGYRLAWVVACNESEQVAGASVFFSPVSGGIDSYFWSQATGNIVFAMTDATHQKTNGFHNSLPLAITPSGQIVGSATRYLPNQSDGGTSVWSWTQAGGIVEINPVDAVHTSSAGKITTTFLKMTPSGRVVGSGWQYASGLSPKGDTVWTWAPGQPTERIGLLDSVFTRANGAQYSYLDFMNDAGTIAGNSEQEKPAVDDRSTAWIWKQGQGTTALGLGGALYTSGTTTRFSRVTALTNDDIVIGYSTKYNGGSSSLGATAWKWTASGGYVTFGLTDAEHTSGQKQHSIPQGITGNGTVYGWSNQFFGSQTSAGTSTWVWTPSTGTTRIGLTGPLYTAASGRRNGAHIANNGASLFVGYSTQESIGTGYPNTTGWVYDASTNTTTALIIGAAPDGSSSVLPKGITSDGLVYGTYSTYDQPIHTQRYFFWTAQYGIVDAGEVAPVLPDGEPGDLSLVKAVTPGHDLLAITDKMTTEVTVYPVNILVRCTADANNDLVVDLNDFFYFFNCFDTTSDCADIDGNPGVDLNDFFAFLNAFDAGC